MAHLVLLIPIISICILWGVNQNSYFSPSGVFLGAWGLFIASHYLLAPDYIFSYEAAFLILTLLLIFFIGDYIGSLIKIIKKPIELLPVNSNEKTIEHIILEKKIRKTVVFFSFLSLAGAFIYLNIFINHFGSLNNLLSSGWLIREEMAMNAISVPLVVRAVALLGYSAVILAMVYWVRFGIKPFIALPFLGIIIMGVAQAARAGTFMLIIIVFVTSYWRDIYMGQKNIGIRLIKRIFIFTFLLLFIFILGLMYREQSFKFNSDEFSQLKNFRIYAVGALSSFSVFLDNYDMNSSLTFGRYTFASLFQLFDLYEFESFGYYVDYLYISRTSDDSTNVYTIFRSAIEDFGFLGSALYMLILGFFSRLAYSKAMKGNLAALSFLIGIYTMFIYAPIAPMTQHNSIIVSWIFPSLILSAIIRRRPTSQHK